MSGTVRSRAACRSCRRVVVAVLCGTVLVVAACRGDDDSTSTIPATVSPAAVDTPTDATTTSTSPASSTTTTTTLDASGSTTTGVPVPTVSTVSTVDLSHQFDFEAPPTDAPDRILLEIYLNFMAAQDDALLNPSDADRRGQLATLTTAEEFAVLETVLDDLLAKGASYRIVEPATYHPFVEYGDTYRDGLRTVADCFTMASARVDRAGNPLPGETLERQSSGYVVEFEVRDGQWLASASYYDPSVCLMG